ncbi:hypothetical protein D7Z54_20555 [Salibacterium salarium]|uniref:Uncharacterized protein n=1 Tax=Salibacterium salarium TaxID=284579 RepID=A0A3R9WQH5_9BACI|nr:hypothetical protein [Salibacterium salarium]RSL31436.1 hypothetical protein D7Z54_20555 [Salibacterium salarium]
MAHSNYLHRNVLSFAVIFVVIIMIFQAKGTNAETNTVDQSKDMEEAQELEILDVIPLNDDGRFLEVTFNKPVQTIDRFNVNIFNEESCQRHGVKKIDMRDNVNENF